MTFHFLWLSRRALTMAVLGAVGGPQPDPTQLPPALSALWQAALRGATILFSITIVSLFLFTAAVEAPDLFLICPAIAAIYGLASLLLRKYRVPRMGSLGRHGYWTILQLRRNHGLDLMDPTPKARRAVAGGLVDLLSKSASVLSLASLILLAALVLAKLGLVRAPRFWVSCPTFIRGLCLLLLMRLMLRRLPTTLGYELVLCSMVCTMLAADESSIPNVFEGAFLGALNLARDDRIEGRLNASTEDVV